MSKSAIFSEHWPAIINSFRGYKIVKRETQTLSLVLPFGFLITQNKGIFLGTILFNDLKQFPCSPPFYWFSHCGRATDKKWKILQSQSKQCEGIYPTTTNPYNWAGCKKKRRIANISSLCVVAQRQIVMGSPPSDKGRNVCSNVSGQ